MIMIGSAIFKKNSFVLYDIWMEIILEKKFYLWFIFRVKENFFFRWVIDGFRKQWYVILTEWSKGKFYLVMGLSENQIRVWWEGKEQANSASHMLKFSFPQEMST
jgi:hypothetical protein